MENIKIPIDRLVEKLKPEYPNVEIKSLTRQVLAIYYFYDGYKKTQDEMIKIVKNELEVER